MTINGPHQNQPILAAGTPLADARAAMIMIHGRGASAENILEIASLVDPGGGVAYLAPQAANATWYPNSFLAPIPANEPGISSGLALIQTILDHIASSGVPTEKTMLLGFSQGACLSMEFIARNARRYGGGVALSGGVIGPEGTPRDYDGSLDGTPIFLGCSDVDFHIPKERVEESNEVFKKMGADVTMRLYPGMGHTTNQDEIDFVSGMVKALVETN